MRYMFDGVTAATVPVGSWAVAGYVNGEWPSYDALVAEFPSAVHLTVSVNATGRAKILDVENGDASPAEAPRWVLDQRAAGDPYPVVYMNQATWPAVKQQFAAQQVTPPLYWVAAYTADALPPSAIPVGAVAVQYYDFGGYDASVVADYWPGVDPEPAPTVVSMVDQKEDPMQIEPLSAHPGEYAIAAAPNVTELVLVADGDDGPPASLRIASWVGDSPLVETIEVGGSAHHSVGHQLPAGCNGVTIRRSDTQVYPVGVAFK